jgi:hypothetical protein
MVGDGRATDARRSRAPPSLRLISGVKGRKWGTYSKTISYDCDDEVATGGGGTTAAG